MNYICTIKTWILNIEGPSWSWWYGCWSYIYLCNQWISPLTLWVRISLVYSSPPHHEQDSNSQFQTLNDFCLYYTKCIYCSSVSHFHLKTKKLYVLEDFFFNRPSFNIEQTSKTWCCCFAGISDTIFKVHILRMIQPKFGSNLPNVFVRKYLLLV